MGWLTLFIEHECPYCKSINNSLRYYNLEYTGGFIDIGDYIPNNLDSDIGFITAKGYCEECKKSYSCKVGIKRSRLMDIVIHEEYARNS